jgi:RNA polymerase sigma-54 factor
MKLTADVSLKQAMVMTQSMRQAIDMLAMSSSEIEQLIDEELNKNPILEEKEHYFSDHDLFRQGRSDSATSFDIAMETTSYQDDFRDHLRRQVGEGKFHSLEEQIAVMLIQNLDDHGFLSDASVFASIEDELWVYGDWIEIVRKRLMDLEPLGCGARDIYEAMTHQIKCVGKPSHQKFIKIIAKLQASPVEGLSLARLKSENHSLAELRYLNPRPSRAFSKKEINLQEIIPDLIVSDGNNLEVSLLKRPSERLMMKGDLKRAKSSSVFILENRKRAAFLLKSLRFRETSLVLVARAIIHHQAGWFANNTGLKPLQLKDIAETCGLHESSISRLVRGKYLSTKKGVFELKYFFSQAVGSGFLATSATFIKDQIRALVSREDKLKPLSDLKIVEKLRAMDIAVSRRTVTKYRKNLQLGPAHERRIFFTKNNYSLAP